MKRGRPFEPGNRFGRGRPKGSPNKKILLAQKIFEDNSPAIMALAINTSRDDRPILRMLASHIVPRRKELPVKLGKLPLKTITDLDRASEAILNKVASGKICLSDAVVVFDLIETRRRVLTTVELEQRMIVLENFRLKEAA
jgi:hypothetical protein